MNTKRRIAAFLSVIMIAMSLPWDAVAVYASQDIITDDTVIISDEVSGEQDKVITDNSVVIADDTGDVIICPDSDDVLTDNKTSDNDNIILSNDEPNPDGDIAIYSGDEGNTGLSDISEVPTDNKLSTDSIERINNTGTINGSYKNVNWSISNTGALTITGSGEFRDADADAPWLEYSDDIITAKVTLTGTKNFNKMFYECNNLQSVDLTGLDSSSAEDMSWMFAYCRSLTSLDMSSMDLSSVQTFRGMCCICNKLEEIKFKNAPVGVRDDTYGNGMYSDMFSSCNALTALDISNFYSCTNCGCNMAFIYCPALTRITLPELPERANECPFVNLIEDSKWKNETTGEITEGNRIYAPVAKGTVFTRAKAGGSGDHLGANIDWDLDNDGLLTVTVDGDMSNPENPNADPYLYQGNWPWYKYRGAIKKADITISENTTKISNMLYGCSNMTSVSFNPDSDASNVKKMKGMFSGCTSLTRVDFSMLDLSSVTDTYCLFDGCTALEEADISTINTYGACDRWEGDECTNGIFGNGNTSLKKITVPAIDCGTDSSQVKNRCLSVPDNTVISYLFGTLWRNTRTGEYASDFIYHAQKGDVFEVSEITGHLYDEDPTDDKSVLWRVVNGTELFIEGEGEISHGAIWRDFYCDFTKVTVKLKGTKDFSNAFDGFDRMESIDLSGTDFSDATDLRAMFRYCSSLTSIEMKNGNADSNKEVNVDRMFFGCRNLKTLDITGIKQSLSNKKHGDSMFDEGCESLEYIALNKDLITEDTGWKYTLPYGSGSLRNYRWVSNAYEGADSYIDSASWEPEKLEKIKEVVYYRQAVTGVTLSPKTLAVKPGNKSKVTANTIYDVHAGGKKMSPVVTSGSLVWVSDPDAMLGVQYKASTISGTKAVSTFDVYAGVVDKDEDATLTAVAFNKRDAHNASITASVNMPLQLNPGALSMTKGTSEQLIATIDKPFKYTDIKWLATDTPLPAGQLPGEQGNKSAYITINDSSAATTGFFTVTGSAVGTAYVYLWVEDTKTGGVYTADCEVKVKVSPKTEKPVASITSGKKVERGTKLTLSSKTEGAKIYYTISTDGTEPDNPKKTDNLFSYAITIDSDMIIKAIAVKDNYSTSKPVTLIYTVDDTDWGDIPETTAVRNLFIKNAQVSPLNVPKDIWYLFKTGNEYIYFYDGKYNDRKTREEKACTTRTYTGNAVTFNNDVQVYYGTRRLWENRDYTLAYANNKAAAEFNVRNKNKMTGPSVTVKGMGNYAANEIFYFTINRLNINDPAITITSEKTVTLTGKVNNKGGTKLNSVKPVVKFGTATLKAGTDYDLHYYNVKANGDDGDEITADTDPKLAGFVVEAGKNYRVRITAHDPGNFSGQYNEPVEVQAVNPKEVIQMSSVTFTIPKRDWTGSAISAKSLFTGENKAVVTAKIGGTKTTLEYDKDFKLDSPNAKFTDAGTYNITIIGKESTNGKFVGSKTAVLTVNGVPAKSVNIACLNTTAEYNGGKSLKVDDLFKPDGGKFKYSDDSSEDFKPFDGEMAYTTPTAPTLYIQKSDTRQVNGKKKTIKWYHKLAKGTDYDVEFDHSGARGKVWLVFKLKGQYTGEIKKQITVNAFNMKTNADNKISVNVKDATFTKSGAIPVVTVKFEDTVLAEGIDYKLTFKNNGKPGKKTDSNAPMVTVTGIGNYTGTLAASDSTKFTINASNLNALELVATDLVFSKTAGKFKVVPSIMEGGKKVTIGTNKDIENLGKNPYSYYYESTGEQIPDKAVVPANTWIIVKVEVSVSEKSPYYKQNKTSKTLEGHYRILDTGKDISKAAVKVNRKLFFANGNEILPPSPEDFEITIGSGKNRVPLDSTDFEIVSVTGNLAPGKATITLKGRGSYGGIKTVVCQVYKRDM